MLYRFRVNVVIRVILLTLSIMVLVAGYNQESLVLLACGSVLVFAVLYSLFYYVDQTNRDVGGFLLSIQYNDFTATSSAAHRGKSFGELYEGFNLIYRKFQEVRADREANHQFLQTIVEHIDVGLLCFTEDGEVKLMNKALQRLLHKSFLLHVDGLQQVNEELWEAVRQAEPGQRELIKVTIDNRLSQLALQATQFRLQNESLRLVSIQNIESELEARELEAWQKLIRILTHEIMNSVAPITSLSGTIHQMLEGPEPPDQNELSDIRESVAVIQRRGEGLLDFTETYRSLTRVPPPNFQVLDAGQLLRDLEQLFKTDAETQGVQLVLHHPPSPITLQGDPNLLEQVLINLAKNALHAVAESEEPTIHLHLNRNQEGRTTIQVADNGMGIPQEQLDQIFVPFYTTKSDGSGIGLSLSRQIMRLHKGRIEVHSVVGEGTVVSLVF